MVRIHCSHHNNPSSIIYGPRLGPSLAPVGPNWGPFWNTAWERKEDQGVETWVGTHWSHLKESWGGKGMQTGYVRMVWDPLHLEQRVSQQVIKM